MERECDRLGPVPEILLRGTPGPTVNLRLVPYVTCHQPPASPIPVAAPPAAPVPVPVRRAPRWRWEWREFDGVFLGAVLFVASLVFIARGH